MHSDRALMGLLRAVSAGDHERATQLLTASPELATARLVSVGATRAAATELFLTECAVYAYAGHTALHVAAAAYDRIFAATLLAAGADVRAKNRRGAEPLHEAVRGGPGAPGWDPSQQVGMIMDLIAAGTDPDALASGGVTPLHRAVRNRCSAAVEALLACGADACRPNGNGSTPLMLASATTGKSGSGSAAAKAEQAAILSLLRAAIA